MDRTVGLKEVAELAGVSMRTVSNVVRGTGRASAATRARVLAAVEELGYRPNPAARGLRTGRSGVLSLAVPDLSMPYFAELADIVMREAALHGCTVLVECTDGCAETELRIALGRGDQLVEPVLVIAWNALPVDEVSLVWQAWKVEADDATADSSKKPLNLVGVLSAGLVVVRENDDQAAGEAFAVGRLPLLRSAVATGSQITPANKSVCLPLALDHQDGISLALLVEQLWQVVEWQRPRNAFEA